MLNRLDRNQKLRELLVAFDLAMLLVIAMTLSAAAAMALGGSLDLLNACLRSFHVVGPLLEVACLIAGVVLGHTD